VAGIDTLEFPFCQLGAEFPSSGVYMTRRQGKQPPPVFLLENVEANVIHYDLSVARPRACRDSIVTRTLEDPVERPV
jgi:hypothetical protein